MMGVQPNHIFLVWIYQKQHHHCFFLKLPPKSGVNCVFFPPNTHENIGPLSAFSEGKRTLNLAMELVAGFLPGVANKVS